MLNTAIGVGTMAYCSSCRSNRCAQARGRPLLLGEDYRTHLPYVAHDNIDGVLGVYELIPDIRKRTPARFSR